MPSAMSGNWSEWAKTLLAVMTAGPYFCRDSACQRGGEEFRHGLHAVGGRLDGRCPRPDRRRGRAASRESGEQRAVVAADVEGQRPAATPVRWSMSSAYLRKCSTRPSEWAVE